MPRIAIASASPRSPCSSAPRTPSIAIGCFTSPDGYDSLLEFLAGAIRRRRRRARLAAPVRRVAWQRGRVRVEQQATAAAAREPRALITVPLGVLQADSHRLRAAGPQISSSTHSAWRWAMWCASCSCSASASGASAVRLHSRWRSAQARGSQLSVHAGRDAADLVDIPSHDPRRCSRPGSAAPRRRSCGARSRRAATPWRFHAAALQRSREFSSMPFAELEHLLVSWHEHDWSADPYSRGAYSYVPAGALDAPAKLTSPSRIRFISRASTPMSRDIGGRCMRRSRRDCGRRSRYRRGKLSGDPRDCRPTHARHALCYSQLTKRSATPEPAWRECAGESL